MSDLEDMDLDLVTVDDLRKDLAASDRLVAAWGDRANDLAIELATVKAKMESLKPALEQGLAYGLALQEMGLLLDGETLRAEAARADMAQQLKEVRAHASKLELEIAASGGRR